jgi:pimeloyl-ACP methyl ester carboxylesterase
MKQAIVWTTVVLATTGGAGVAQQARTADRVAVSGGHVVLDAAGSGPAVVFLHGAFMDRRTWDRQMTALAPRYRVVRYDIRPFGESTPPEKPYRPIDDLREVLDALTIDRAHLVGHSFGGGVAIDFALAHPDRVASLVLVNSGVTGAAMPADEQKEAAAVFLAARESDDKAVEAWLRLRLWSASIGRPEVMRAVEDSVRRNLKLFKMEAPPFAQTEQPAKDHLGDVRAPTLVVSGDRDTPGNRAAAEMAAQGIPKARLEVIPGADHAIPIGWADRLNELLLTFFAAK